MRPITDIESAALMASQVLGSIPPIVVFRLPLGFKNRFGHNFSAEMSYAGQIRIAAGIINYLNLSRLRLYLMSFIDPKRPRGFHPEAKPGNLVSKEQRLIRTEFNSHRVVAKWILVEAGSHTQLLDTLNRRKLIGDTPMGLFWSRGSSAW